MIIQTTDNDHRIAWLAALAIAIHIMESSLPSPVPGIKPGLSNVITIIVLIRLGWNAAAWISIMRVLCGSIILGTFLSPTFIMSLTGAVCSMIVLYAGTRLPGTGFGPVGYSVLAALAHMAGQFTVAYYLFIPHPALLHLFPVLITAALIFGVISGIITLAVINGLNGDGNECSTQ